VLVRLASGGKLPLKVSPATYTVRDGQEGARFAGSKDSGRLRARPRWDRAGTSPGLSPCGPG